MKCKRCSYVWLPCGSRLIPRNGNLYMVDLGVCRECDHATSRVHAATPGDQVSAMLWGEQRFEVIKKEGEEWKKDKTM